MPRPHHPIRGGVRHYAAKIAQDPQASAAACSSCDDKKAEIERLRRELSRVRSGAQNQSGSRPMPFGLVWAALAICGVGLLFALTAVMRHG